MRWFGTGIDVEEGSQKEMLRVAEKRTLELSADGASSPRSERMLCCHRRIRLCNFVCVFVRSGQQSVGPDRRASRPSRIWDGDHALADPVPIEALAVPRRLRKIRVIIRMSQNDPQWPDEVRSLALEQGIRAAWSAPPHFDFLEKFSALSVYPIPSRGLRTAEILN